jgi:CP family cyanate transporter-like MFS transporter
MSERRIAAPSRESGPTETGRTYVAGGAALGGAAVLAAFNLRPAISSVGPLLEEVRHGLGMSPTVAGALTSLPALCFAIAGTGAPRLARRLGTDVVVAAAMVVLAAGLALRPIVGGGEIGFLAFSAVALAGIGVANVVMPALVKRHFPDRIGAFTGLYSMALTFGAAVAAAVSVPLANRFGGSWRVSLALWAIPAGIAALAFFGVIRRNPPTAVPPPVESRPAGRLVHSRTAWSLAVFFGLQATGAYVVLGWMPQIMRDAGVSADTAGVLLALTPAVGVPFALLLPALAARRASQSGFAIALAAVGLLGYGGLWLAPATAPWAWAVLLGVSQASFPLALTMIGLRSGSTSGTVALSTFAQGIGYLISIPGPVVVGALYQHTGGWAWPLAFMAALLLPQAIAGAFAGRSSPG